MKMKKDIPIKELVQIIEELSKDCKTLTSSDGMSIFIKEYSSALPYVWHKGISRKDCDIAKKHYALDVVRNVYHVRRLIEEDYKT